MEEKFRTVFLVLFFFTFAVAFGQSVNAAPCEDSDNGINLLMSGRGRTCNIFFCNPWRYDSCIPLEPWNIKEVYCAGNVLLTPSRTCPTTHPVCYDPPGSSSASQGAKCVECTENYHCPAGEYCRTETHTCEPACVDSDDSNYPPGHDSPSSSSYNTGGYTIQGSFVFYDSCSGNQIVERYCDTANSQASRITNCPSGTCYDPPGQGEEAYCQTCTNECSSYGEVGCAGNTPWQCGNNDADSCLEKIYGNACPAGTACNPSTASCNFQQQCNNECSPQGATMCVNNGTQATCGNYDEDCGLEWGNLQSCGGPFCSNNQCQPPTCTPHSYLECWNNDVYWYDSCNEIEDRAEDCPFLCNNAQCVQCLSNNDCQLNYACQGGSCVYNPGNLCLPGACTPYCVGPNLLRTFNCNPSNGNCDWSGDVSCQYGCNSGTNQCNPSPPQPCEGLVCEYGCNIETNQCNTSPPCEGLVCEYGCNVGTNQCNPAPLCGNGYRDVLEECDDGNAENTDACTNSCEDAICGDGFQYLGVEECDDGNLENNDGCNSECLEENPESEQFCTSFNGHSDVVKINGSNIIPNSCDDYDGIVESDLPAGAEYNLNEYKALMCNECSLGIEVATPDDPGAGLLTDLHCTWNSINNRCQLTGVSIDGTDCVVEQIESEQCESGRATRTVRFISDCSPNCSPPDGCEREVPCPRVIKLPFFGEINFVLSIVFIYLIYFYFSKRE